MTTKPQATTELGVDTNFPLSETLRLLVEWAQHLHVSHECDCDGWEQRSFLIEAAQRYQVEIAQASASAAPVVDNNDLISRAEAKAAMCNMCANQDRYKPAEPLEGSMRLFHFQRSDNWNAGQCLAQAIDSVPATAATAAPQQPDAGKVNAVVRAIMDHFLTVEIDELPDSRAIRAIIERHLTNEGAR